MEQQTAKPGKFGSWLKTSITARMIMIKILILILLIPLALVKDLIREREHRQQDVISQINEKHGSNVIFYGPILKVPYKTYSETTIYNEKTKLNKVERKVVTSHAYFFPEELDIDCQVDSEEKKLNNYKSAVYKSNFTVSGAFTTPNFSSKKIAEKDILWDEATLIIKTSNLKGIKSNVAITLNDETYAFETNFQNNGNHNSSLSELESNFLDLKDLPVEKNKSFQLKLTYNGSKSLQFIPIGKTTKVAMTSNWNNPNFINHFLPHEKSITQDGFNANWLVLQINRSFSQQFFGALPNLNSFALGANFIFPIDEYQKSERSTKYGFLVIGLTFLFFFLIQTLSKIHIHPFQYLMIGIALIMFYSLLISISEHSSFFKAYIIAGIAVIALITGYSKSILKNIKFPMLIGLSLTMIYGFIFVIIQLENYALLVGSVGLFLILAIVMFISRKIDWQNG